MSKWMSNREKEKALSYHRMSANKCRRKEGIRQSPLGNYHSKNWSRQEISNSVVWWEAGYLHSLGLSHDKILLHLKRNRKNNFTVEKPGRHHVNQVIQGNTNRNGTSVMCRGGHDIASVAFLPQMYNLANHQATADRLKGKDILQNNWPVPL